MIHPKEKEALKHDGANSQQKEPKIKKERRDKSDLGEDFVAPDGGWAWMVCIAAGMSNLSLYPCLQQFGLIFRERLMYLGMTNSQITTIINTNAAVSACTGLLNGPMFRRFTFRQVAFCAGLIVFCGIIASAFCETFGGYIISYSLLLGFGAGISVSSSSLALNTYFQQKRRRAAGFSWTITGLGPIFWPYTISYLRPTYGVFGTCLIFGAISLHTLLSAIIYQPVHLHTKKQQQECCQEEPLRGEEEKKERDCEYCGRLDRREKGLFSSQYLYQDDDIDNPGYEITDPGTPMLSRANDGWFGSKLSLASTRMRMRTVSSAKDMDPATIRLRRTITREEDEHERADSVERLENRGFFKPNNFNRERDEISSPRQFYRSNSTNRCTCGKNGDAGMLQRCDSKDSTRTMESSNKSVTFFEKVVAFFDLDLLKDFTFVNLVIGLTIINFGELNFSLLTPFILNDFGFSMPQITMAMSILAGCDITVRFLVPFVTEKIPWDNRVFFLIGVVGIALGRTVVACTRSFSVILPAFCWIGLCKGVRTIFWPLILPSYVPLHRLPAASGLQLLVTGIFSLCAGPFVGLIRDRFNYSICLHFLNMLSFLAAFSWTTEALIRRAKEKRQKT